MGFGFFYLVFPGGSHFGLTMANSLAVYVCLFVTFRDAGFPEAPGPYSAAALATPFVAFLGACFFRRRRVAATIHARRSRLLKHMPRMGRWLPAIFLVGALSFLVPRFDLSAGQQGEALVLFMAVIGLIVSNAVNDVVLLLMDVALVFESLAGRLDRLVMPIMAFLTIYSLLVVVFACLYRIADQLAPLPQFSLFGKPHPLEFPDALYFSVVTLSTVGYGDIVPMGPFVRGLVAIQVVMGLLLLLFGFSEIMRSQEAARGNAGNEPSIERSSEAKDMADVTQTD